MLLISAFLILFLLNERAYLSFKSVLPNFIASKRRIASCYKGTLIIGISIMIHQMTRCNKPIKIFVTVNSKLFFSFVVALVHLNSLLFRIKFCRKHAMWDLIVHYIAILFNLFYPQISYTITQFATVRY